MILYVLVSFFIASSMSDNEGSCKRNNFWESDTKYLVTKADNSHESALLKDLTIHKGVHLAVVACGDKLDETLTMIKSALFFNSGNMKVHIFADDFLKQKFENALQAWKLKLRIAFDFNIYSIQFPFNEFDEWKNLFKPCSSQRLFIHDILKEIDSLIYVDTDVLFLRPIEDLWKYFTNFNSTQIAGAAAEHEEPRAGWYNRFAQHPYVPPYGINSGVMLMNLTRIRSNNWLKYIIPYYREFRYKITWGDQDLINIYFYYHPEELYQFPCGWNYRPDHCMYMSNCKDAEHHGVSILHGNRETFHNDKMPMFKAVYDSFYEMSLANKSTESFKEGLNIRINLIKATECGSVSSIFTKNLFKYFG